MQQTLIPSSTSLVRFGMARADITPPVGIYHRMWGAARHDRAAGVHRPSTGDVVIFEPREKDGAAARLIRVQLDHVGLAQEHHQSVVTTISQAGDVPPEQVIVTYSHTHSGGLPLPDRFELPGGDLIVPYLDDMNGKLRAACVAAIEQVEDATVTYATGWSDMAANRDCWDAEFNGYVCGFNPDESIDNRVLVGRVTDEQDALRHVFVHYACHPTTLAWEKRPVESGLRGRTPRRSGAAHRSSLHLLTGAVRRDRSEERTAGRYGRGGSKRAATGVLRPYQPWLHWARRPTIFNIRDR